MKLLEQVDFGNDLLQQTVHSLITMINQAAETNIMLQQSIYDYVHNNPNFTAQEILDAANGQAERILAIGQAHRDFINQVLTLTGANNNG